MRLHGIAGVAAGLIALSAPAAAQVEDFILGNETGQEITTIETSPTGQNRWIKPKFEEEKTAIKPQQRVTVPMAGAGTGCKFDIRATTRDGRVGQWTGIDLCDASAVWIRYDADGKPVFRTN